MAASSSRSRFTHTWAAAMSVGGTGRMHQNTPVKLRLSQDKKGRWKRRVARGYAIHRCLNMCGRLHNHSRSSVAIANDASSYHKGEATSLITGWRAHHPHSPCRFPRLLKPHFFDRHPEKSIMVSLTRNEWYAVGNILHPLALKAMWLAKTFTFLLLSKNGNNSASYAAYYLSKP